jgi:hypothetical protein
MFIFRSVKNMEVFLAASMDGLAAVRKTNAIHAVYGGPENK